MYTSYLLWCLLPPFIGKYFVFNARLHLNLYTSWLFVYRKFNVTISHANLEQVHSHAEFFISTGYFSKVEANKKKIASS